MEKKTMEVMTKLVNDPELYAGGIPAAIIDLEELGLTEIQAGAIVSRLFKICRKVRDKANTKQEVKP